MPNAKVIEYYSVNSSHVVDVSLYINKLSVAESEQEDLIEVLAWQCAADVLQVMEQPELADKALNKVNEFIISNSI